MNFYDKNNSIHTQGGPPTNWKILYHRAFPTGVRVPNPSQFHSLGVWEWEQEPLDHLALKASGAWAQDLHRTGINRDSTLGMCTHLHVHSVPGQRKDSITIYTRPTCGSWRVSWGGRSQLYLTVGSRQWRQKFQRLIIDISAPEVCYFEKYLAPPSSRPPPVLRSSGITTNKEGIKPHPSAYIHDA